jgi:DNA-binding transcriptional LysR family regulator
MHDLNTVEAFVAVAQTRSFRAAGDRLGVSRSAVSQAIGKLEARLGVALFKRTTRSVSLTEIGERLADQVLPGFAAIASALDEARGLSAHVAGRVRVHAWRLGFERHVAPMLRSFAEAFPEVELDICIDDAVIDLVQHGYDVGVRLGDRVERDMIASPLGPDLHQVAVASPDYVRRHGMPKSPADLVHHNCIRWRWSGEANPYRWEFIDAGRVLSIGVTGSLIVNDQHAAVLAAVDGLGIAFRAEQAIGDFVASGRLVVMLREWAVSYPGFHVCYPRQRNMSPATRAFVNALEDATRSEGPSPGSRASP